MNRLPFVLQSRGVRNSIERAVSISHRFGFQENDFLKRLHRFSEMLQGSGARPSFPISTVLLERYPDLARRLPEIPADFLSHGHTHVDYSILSRSEQRRLIGKSRALLNDLGRDPSGFRAPYLHWSDPLLRVVREAGFQFDSSSVVWWTLTPEIRLSEDQTTAYLRARQFYERFQASAGTSGMPYFRDDGLLEIPVSLPDDEIMIDRLFMRDAAVLARVWRHMLEETHAAGGLLNLQLHPERILMVGEALQVLLHASRTMSPAVWVTSLAEIHHWWRNKPSQERWPAGFQSAICISGDIDCATLQDFFWRFVEKG